MEWLTKTPVISGGGRRPHGCQFDKEPTFKLRGLCKDALMDTQYELAEPEPMDLSKSTLYHDRANYGKNVRGFVGPKGWVISRNKTNDKWMMTYYHYTDYTLTMVDKNKLRLKLCQAQV